MWKFFKKKSSSSSGDENAKTNGSPSSSNNGVEGTLTPLEQLKDAVEQNNTTQVKKLLAAYPTIASASIDELGQTCLHLAATMGNLDCLELLCKYGDVNAADSSGCTALHAGVSHRDILMLLLKKKAVNVNRLAYHRQSVLHFMAKKFVPVDDELWNVLRKVRVS